MGSRFNKRKIKSKCKEVQKIMKEIREKVCKGDESLSKHDIDNSDEDSECDIDHSDEDMNTSTEIVFKNYVMDNLMN